MPKPYAVAVVGDLHAGSTVGLMARPVGAKSSLELREEFGVSRSIMQKALKKLYEEGKLQKRRIVERGPDGKAVVNVVYWKV